MYKKRYLEEIVREITRTFKILYVGGPRQVGKTTLLSRLAEEIGMHSISLDDLNARKLAQEDPALFLQRYQAPLFIDEVQYAPQLFTYLKINVDKQESNGQYWLSGSQQFSIMRNVQESLAGRVGILHLLGFSFAEIKESPRQKEPFIPGEYPVDIPGAQLPEIFHRIFQGSFPVFFKPNPPQTEFFYNSYLQTYLDRDLRDIFHVEKIPQFQKFLQLCAARTGQILNYSELARDAEISLHAAKEWIGILEAGMQIYLLRPFSRNISKRFIKAPKLYFLDTGLAAYLTQWKNPETLSSGAMAGAFFETFVVSEIIKSYLYRGHIPPLFYFRDHAGHEVDIIIERNNRLFPIEVKMSAKINNFDLKGILYLRQKLNNVEKGAVVCLAKERLPIDSLNDLVPVSYIS